MHKDEVNKFSKMVKDRGEAWSLEEACVWSTVEAMIYHLHQENTCSKHCQRSIYWIECLFAGHVLLTKIFCTCMNAVKPSLAWIFSHCHMANTNRTRFPQGEHGLLRINCHRDVFNIFCPRKKTIIRKHVSIWLLNAPLAISIRMCTFVFIRSYNNIYHS